MTTPNGTTCDCGHHASAHVRPPNACACSEYTKSHRQAAILWGNGHDWTCSVGTKGCQAPGCACGSFSPGNKLERPLVLSIAKAKAPVLKRAERSYRYLRTEPLRDDDAWQDGYVDDDGDFRMG